MRNRRWVLAAHPHGQADASTWTLEETDVPEPGPGQIVVRSRWLSVDPYMRGRLNPGAMRVGDLMQGGGIGEVTATRHPGWQVGELAEAWDVGWQEYAVLTPDQAGAASVNRVDPSWTDPQSALSWRGMPGITAYFAMMELGRPCKGDVVVVSAAAGAVGQIAGQIAKHVGCRVIGIAGTEEKLAWCKSIGFDDGILHRDASGLTAAIARACPGGVNVFFDGTGGPIHDAVLKNLALHARVAIVGRVAVANRAADDDIGLRCSARLIATRATVQGFVVYDWWHRRDEALRQLSEWHTSGVLTFREDVVHGIESVPHAFLRMMRGDNRGKQLVRI